MIALTAEGTKRNRSTERPSPWTGGGDCGNARRAGDGEWWTESAYYGIRDIARSIHECTEKINDLIDKVDPQSVIGRMQPRMNKQAGGK